MKILITGVAGFIGYHLVKRLLSMRVHITGIDNLNNFYDINLKKNRLEILKLEGLKNKNFFFKELDINDMDSLKSDFDLIIHLAAQAGVRVPKNMEKNYQYSNILGFKEVVSYALKNKITNFIYASSSSVYDDNDKTPYSEKTTNLNPKSTYGKTKQFNEEYINIISNQVNFMRFIGLRFFSVYGPYGRPDMAYYLFTRSILNNEDIKLHNSGKMSRDMTYIDDIVDGIVLSIKYTMNPANIFKNKIFNLGNDYPISTLKLLNVIEKNLNMRAKVTNIKARNESKITHADISKSKKELGYDPKFTLDIGMEKFISWLKRYESET